MHLEPASHPDRPLWRRHPLGLACAVLGAAGLVAASAMMMAQDSLFGASPDLRVTVPVWAAAVLAGAASEVRRERNHGLVIAGVALASAALALGYLLVLAAVVMLALVVLYALSHVF